MAIDFSPDRWDKVKETYRKWWSGELDRPIIPVELIGRDPGRPEPDVALLTQETCSDLSVSPEQIIDRLDYELSKKEYLGDAFPYVNMDSFGPGVIAAFCGAVLDNSSGRVWFHPPKDLPISEIHLEYNKDNIWLKRIKDIYAAGMERWKGQVLMGMTDLGGNLDILSTFRPSEALLYDLYDYPEEVQRLTWEANELWHRFYKELNGILQPVNPGYSDWSGIYSSTPTYILQCDFCYMISPDMFEEFVKPELQVTCERLEHTVYHLDGPGQLRHLDSLLSIEKLDGIQWIPGAGNPDCSQWPEVYRKIHTAGKRIQAAWTGFEGMDAIISQIGTGKGIQHTIMQCSIQDKACIKERLKTYGIE